MARSAAPFAAAHAALLAVGLLSGLTALAQDDAPVALTDVEHPYRPAPILERLLGATETHALVVYRDDLHSQEPWLTDGVEAPALVRDIAPGAPSLNQYSPLATLNGLAFFLADDRSHGPELWQSDGTAAGTRLTIDAVPGARGLPDTPLMATTGSHLFLLSAWTERGFNETTAWLDVWITDGTHEETHRVFRFDDESEPLAVHPVGELLYFVISPFGAPEPQLWRTDGTEGGTFQLATVVVDFDERPALASSDTHLYFVSNEGDAQQLWRTDGTVAGTEAVTDVEGGLDVAAIGVVGEMVLFASHDFTAGDEPWVLDDSPEGAHRLVDLEPGFSDSRPRHFVSFDGVGYFVAEVDGVTRLFKTDGTEEGTTSLADALANVDLPLAALSDRLLFWEPSAGVETYLSSTDGTVEGTVRLATLFEEYPSLRLAHGGAYAWLIEGQYPAFSLTRTDGTLPGTTSVPAPEGVAPDGFTAGPVRVGDRAIFYTAGQLYGSDGSEADLEPLGLAFTSTSDVVLPAGERALFNRSDEGGVVQIFETDGTADGTLRLTDAASNVMLRGVPGVVGERTLVLLTQTGITLELYALEADGSLVKLTDANPMVHGAPTAAAPLGDGIVFFAESADEPGSARPWFTDGTPGGTYELSDAVAAGAVNQAVAYEGTVYFVGSSDLIDYEVWRTDGTLEGTVEALDLADDPWGSLPQVLRVAGGRLFFVAHVRGAELYASDGTLAGTSQVTFLRDDELGSSPQQLTAWDGRLAFLAGDDETGVGVYVTDGTEAGTARLALDATPGVPLEAAADGSATGGTLLLAAGDADGAEPWVSCGEAFTRIADLHPGKLSSNPGPFVAVGDGLLFAANAGDGPQLWRVPLAAANCPSDPGGGGGDGNGNGEGDGEGDILEPSGCACGSAGGVGWLPWALVLLLGVRRTTR